MLRGFRIWLGLMSEAIRKLLIYFRAVLKVFPPWPAESPWLPPLKEAFLLW
jgi:hypothetical protein